jgi:hypothetical protein
MRSIGIPSNYGYVEEPLDLGCIIEIEIISYDQEPDLHAADEILPEHNIVKNDYFERELDNNELEWQRKEYFDSINSPVLPLYKPK